MIPPSPMHNPPGQVMDRDDVYDPQRIPSSVFAASDSATPADWSIGSNESLFSIQVGNMMSLSREQTLYLSGELERLTRLSKEGELSRAELKDLRKLSGLNKSLEFSTPKPHPSTIPEVENEIASEIEEESNLEGQKEKEIEVHKEKLVLEEKNEEGHKHRPSSTHSSNPSARPSDVSIQSTYSFNFPILGQTEKSAPISGQSGKTWEAAKNSLETQEPVAVKKRRCLYCFSCNCCPLSWPRCFSCSCCPFSWPRCCSCSRCTLSLPRCFSCNRCSSWCSFSICSSCCACLNCWKPKWATTYN